MNPRAERLLGLARRAGKVRAGEVQTEESIRRKRARLCLVAADASDNTKKKCKDLCRTAGIPCIGVSESKEALGHMIGSGERSALTVEDPGFAKSLISFVEGGNACDERE